MGKKTASNFLGLNCKLYLYGEPCPVLGLITGVIEEPGESHLYEIRSDDGRCFFLSCGDVSMIEVIPEGLKAVK